VWLETLKSAGVTTDNTYLNDFPGLLRHFKNNISGYVMFNMSTTLDSAGDMVIAPYANRRIRTLPHKATFNSI